MEKENKNILYHEDRPWGFFDNLLEENNMKVKRLYVKPGQKLSYQYHNKRDELWTVIKGNGTLVLDDKDIPLTLWSVNEIKKLQKHRLIAGDDGIEIIEVQTGDYLEEDDIVRLDDDYGRK